MKNKFFVAVLVCLSMAFSAAADVYDDIATAIRAGNYKELAAYFNKNIEMNILSHEGNYTKNEAENILKDFFMKNPPKSFVILHQGNSKEGARYAIGSLVTTQGTNYRTYFFVKQGVGKSFIQELRFEKE
jgi:opacity protein-like surface antigen